jgi:hypothetical protein
MASPASCCTAALREATQLWPNRNRASDGIMGDPSHRARKSDHNDGNAFDLTHDPANGCDAHGLVEGLKQRRDPRVKYIISNSRIWNPSVSPDWRPYKGANPHTKHAHVSIVAGARDNTAPWWGGGAAPAGAMATGAAPPFPGRVLERGVKGDDVRTWQARMAERGWKIAVDGDFGPGSDDVCRKFQAEKGLAVDGKVGPQTWAATWSAPVT